MSGFSHATQAIRQGILSQCLAFHRGSFLHGLVCPSRKNLPRKLLKFYKAGQHTLKIILKAKTLFHHVAINKSFLSRENEIAS